jgi:type III secretory pathway component EscU
MPVKGKAMEMVLKVVAVLAMIPVFLFMLRALLLLPNVLAQVSADGVTGTVNQIKASFHYLKHVEELKTIYIRDGKFTHKPLSLISNNARENCDSTGRR